MVASTHLRFVLQIACHIYFVANKLWVIYYYIEFYCLYVLSVSLNHCFSTE